MKDYEQLTQMTNELLRAVSPDCEAIYESESDNIVVRRRSAYVANNACNDGIPCVGSLVDFARENDLAMYVTSRPRKGTLLIDDHCYPCVILF